MIQPKFRTISVSKDTLSRWCKDIVLTEKQKFRLINLRKYGQKKGSIIAAENKRSSRLKKIKQYQIEGKKEIGKLTN